MIEEIFIGSVGFIVIFCIFAIITYIGKLVWKTRDLTCSLIGGIFILMIILLISVLTYILFLGFYALGKWVLGI